MDNAGASRYGRKDSPKLLLGVLTGFLLSFLIAAGIAFRVRRQMSRMDGENLLHASAIVFLLVAVAAFVVWRLQRKQTRSRSWLAIAVGGLLAVGVVFVLLFSIPTQRFLRDQEIGKHQRLWQDQAAQLATVPERVDRFLANEPDDKRKQSMHVALNEAKMDFRHNMFDDFPEEWNAFVVNDSDFARLKIDTDPETIMGRYDAPDLPIFKSKTLEHKRMIDTLATIAYGDGEHTFRAEEVASLARAMNKMKYLAFVRMVIHNPPSLVENSFVPGYSAGQAVFFDLSKDRIIGGCRFAATNREEVKFRYSEGRFSKDEYKDSAAIAHLHDDLKDNLRWAFFHEVGKISQKSMTELTERVDEQPPFSAQSLALAKAIAMQQNSAEANPTDPAAEIPVKVDP